ncbi:MAG TPA: SPFH domain-containing protein [Fimbriimonadaceae bacterium]|nr:SPFH domain-containing protein [Fimbriimonadaceae bacterium]
MGPLLVVGVVLAVLLLLFVLSLPGIIYICAPNEVLIFSGKKRREGDRVFGYRLIKGGKGFRIPMLERVDRMDLTNMVIDVSASNAYSKGGIPLTVQGVANVKIAGHEPVLNNAIERLLGRSRQEIMQVAKATLEGSLRGILSTMTPEQVNEDKILFAERLVHEVEQDMTSLGLVVDTMKIQNVHDEVKYLDSIGRKRNAEIISQARIAEAKAKADSVVRQAENMEQEANSQIAAQIAMAKADAQRRLTDALTRRDALIAEEMATVAAQVAQAKAEVDVQNARIEQIRSKLQADVIQPAKAAAEATENQAKANVAAIIEDGKARAEALRAIAQTWKEAGPSAKQIMLLQRLDPIMKAITQTVAETKVEKLTMIGGDGASGPAKALPMLEQVKEVFGIDVVEKLKQLGSKEPTPVHVSVTTPSQETAKKSDAEV